MKMEYQCLFHTKYEPYINVRPRKYIIVVPSLCKCKPFTFLCLFLLYKKISLKPYTLTVLPSDHMRQHKSLLPFVPSLEELLHLHRFIALAFTTK